MNIDSPRASDDPSVLADWIELVAVFSQESRALFDQIIDATGIEEDTEGIDIAEEDARTEALIESVIEAITVRAEALKSTAYPFRISNNGKVLEIFPQLGYAHHVYLASLCIHHSWRNGKLFDPLKMTPDELQEGRNHFEVFTAVAALGISKGPTFLLGSNRNGAQGLLQRIQRICETVGEGRAREVLHQDAPIHANDDGIDVLSVELENDGPPHRNFWFCQSATGANYKVKPVINEIERFLEIWFENRPVNCKGALFVPAMLDAKTVNNDTRRLGQLYHRLRMPHYVHNGFRVFRAEAHLLEYVNDIQAPIQWLDRYLERAQQEQLDAP